MSLPEKLDFNNASHCKAFLEALKEVVEKLHPDVTMKSEGGKLGGGSFTAKIAFVQKSSGGLSIKEQRERNNMEFYASTDNIDLNKVVDGYRIVGYNSRAHKKPWILEKNGKRFVGREEYVKRMFTKG
jgi:hypothetical protein